VDALLAGWHGVVREGEAVAGFWGLSPQAISAHAMDVNGVTAYAWCAWDTLFLPGILGTVLHVASRDPETGQDVRATVAPEGVRSIEPAGAVLSMLEPQPEMMADIRTHFCRNVRFFASPRSGAAWTARHPGTALMTPADGHALGRVRNAGQFGEALRLPQP